MRPSAVKRIALRFVNRIILPDAVSDLSEYFRLLPNIPADMPSSAPRRFFMQLEMPQDDIPNAVAVVNEALLTQEEDSSPLSLLLDVDIYQELSARPDGEDIWDLFEVLHQRKNDIFEKSITPRTRERFY